MAEETPVVATPAAAEPVTPATPPAPAEPAGEEGISQPLFADEGSKYSEAELMGEDLPPEGDEPPVEKQPETPPPSGEPQKKEEAAQKEQPPAKESAEKEPGKDKESDPVAKATEGLRHELTETRKQSREAISRLQAENDQLRSQLVQKETAPVTTEEDEKWKDFKIKTKEELAGEDVESVQEYLIDLDAFKEYKGRKALAERRAADTEARRKQADLQMASIVNTAVEEMDAAIPGLRDPETGVSDGLIKFAEGYGLDPKLFLALSDPATMISVRGEDGRYARPRPAGRGSASLVKTVNNLKAAFAEVEQRVREEVTKELTKKFTDAGGRGDVTLGDVPASRITIEDHGQYISEEEFATMDPKKKEKYLGG